MNDPYCDIGFFAFFPLLMKRVCLLFPGGVCPDEIQICVLIALTSMGMVLGPLLIYRKITMMANALSHTILLGIALVYLVFLLMGREHIHALLDTKVLMGSALFSALLTLGMHYLVKHVFSVQHEAAIGFVFTSLFAFGIILISMISKNAHIGTELIMGNIDAVGTQDAQLIGITACVQICLFLLFYRGFIITTFDPTSALLFGYHPKIYHFFVVLMTACATVVSFKAVGVFMALAFLLVPTLIAIRLSHRYRLVMLITMGVGTMLSITSVALSRAIYSYFNMGLSTGGIAILCLAICYASLFLRGKKELSC